MGGEGTGGGYQCVIKLEFMQLKTSHMLPKICSYSWVAYKRRDLDYLWLSVCVCVRVCVFVCVYTIWRLHKYVRLFVSACLRLCCTANQLKWGHLFTQSNVPATMSEAASVPLSVSDITYLEVSAAASQATRAIPTANLMDCYVSHLKPVLPFVTQSVRIDCERGILKGKSPRKLQGLKGCWSRITPSAGVSEWVKCDRLPETLDQWLTSDWLMKAPSARGKILPGLSKACRKKST